MENKPHPKMPQGQRAKQFAPFDALTGFGLALERKKNELMANEENFLLKIDKDGVIMDSKRVKRYVSVVAEHTADGEIIPLKITLENRVYPIDDAKAVMKTAMFSGGSARIRYRIRIHGKETFLYQEADRWYVEAKQ